MRARVLALNITAGNAEAGKNRRVRRDQNLGHADLARVGPDVQWPAAAIGVNDKICRMIALFDGDSSDQIGHMGIDNLQDSLGGREEIQTQGQGDLFLNRLSRQLHSQFFSAAKETLRIDPAQY